VDLLVMGVACGTTNDCAVQHLGDVNGGLGSGLRDLEIRYTEAASPQAGAERIV
jgi:hypothetical protein